MTPPQIQARFISFDTNRFSEIKTGTNFTKENLRPSVRRSTALDSETNLSAPHWASYLKFDLFIYVTAARGLRTSGPWKQNVRLHCTSRLFSGVSASVGVALWYFDNKIIKSKNTETNTNCYMEKKMADWTKFSLVTETCSEKESATTGAKPKSTESNNFICIYLKLSLSTNRTVLGEK